jgi:homopolymeric O-antigen transport system permease protein
MFSEYSTSLSGPWRHRTLAFNLARRDFGGRFRNSYLGIAWPVVTSVVMLAIYGFVFSKVFSARWHTPTRAPGDVAVFLFAGLLHHSFLAEVASRSTTVILSNVNLVKRVLFPVEVLPLATVLAAALGMSVAAAILIIAILFTNAGLSIWALTYPAIALPFVVMMCGVSWLLSSLSVFFRDLQSVVTLATTAALFMSPVFYPVDQLPHTVQLFFYLNPLTFVIEQARTVLIDGGKPDLCGLAVYWAAAICVYFVGLATFRRLRGGFGDVL